MKDVQEHFAENPKNSYKNKTLKIKRYTMFMNRKIQYCKDVKWPPDWSTDSIKSNQILALYFIEIDQLILKRLMEMQRTS